MKNQPHITDDPEFRNFMLQKPALSRKSMESYITALENFVKYTGEPFYRTVYELRSLQNDRIEDNMIIRFNPNQSKINLMQYEFIDFLRRSGCRDSTANTYVRMLRGILNTLGIILPKPPKLDSTPQDWYLLSKEDLKYIIDVSSVNFKAIINFLAVTGMRIHDLTELTVRDFMVATEDYHECSEVDDFLQTAPKGMMGYWELIPHKTRRNGIPCKVCNTPESSDLIVLALNERVKYFERKNEEEGLNLKLTKNDPLFASRNSLHKEPYDPHMLGMLLGRRKFKLKAERERVFRYRYEQGEISRETYEESIEAIPNFHAHALRKFFITTLAQNRVDARISAIMEGHRAPIATDSHYVNEDYMKESVKSEYMRCIPDLSFENVEVRFLTSEERRSLEEKIAELEEENRTMRQNMETYVDRAVEERMRDTFGDWLKEQGYGKY